MTSKLSNTQRTILTAAGSSADRIVLPEHVALKGGAVRIVLTSLLKRGLLEEVQAPEGRHTWWSSEGGDPLGLKVTEAGCEAVGVAPVAAPAGDASFTPKTFRPGSKQATLIALLQREEGATLEEMVAATGWLSHTVRGAMAGALKKRLGMDVRSEKVEGRGRVYRSTASLAR